MIYLGSLYIPILTILFELYLYKMALVWRQIIFFSRKKIRFLNALDLSNALNRLNNGDPPLHAHLILSYHLIWTPRLNPRKSLEKETWTLNFLKSRDADPGWEWPDPDSIVDKIMGPDPILRRIRTMIPPSANFDSIS